MAFSKLIPGFTKPCRNKNHAQLIREDSEVVLEITKEDFDTSQQKTGYFLESPLFPNDDKVQFQWKVRFYPKLENEKYSGHSSIFLLLMGKKIEISISAVVRFEINTETNVLIKAMEMEHIYRKPPQSWGYGKFCEISKLTSSLEENSPLFVCVKVCAYYEAYSCYTSNLISERKLLNDYSNLLESGEFSDVTIRARAIKIKAHRAILASRSKVFAAMLSSEMAEKMTGEIVINDLSVYTVRNMLNFIYSCEINFKYISTTLELLKAADKYDLADLKFQCAEYLSSNISKHNAVDILNAADLCNLSDLKNSVLKYICTNNNEFSDGMFYDILSEENPRLLIEVTKELSKCVDITKLESVKLE